MKDLNAIILITGGTGFAGSHLVEALQKKGYKNIHVTTYDLRETYINQLLSPENIHQLDLTNQKATEELLSQLQPNQIYHLAATASVGNSFDQIKQTLDNNLTLQLNLFDAVKKHIPDTKILAVGSALEYETHNLEANQKISENTPFNPASPYALSKIMQDMISYLYGQTYNLNVVRVRPFNHIGERQAPGFVVSDFANQIVSIEQGQQSEIKVGNLEAIRDFTDVKDITAGYILLMNLGVVGEVYNLGSGVGYTIQKVLDILTSFSHQEIKIEIDQNKFRPLDVKSVIADNEKVKELGWQPTIKLEDTLERVLNWHRSNPL